MQHIGIKYEGDQNSQGEHVTKIESWIGKKCKVTLVDKRILIGQFICTDSDSNIILEGCAEYTERDVLKNLEPKMIGLALILAEHIVGVFIEDDTYRDSKPCKPIEQ